MYLLSLHEVHEILKIVYVFWITVWVNAGLHFQQLKVYIPVFADQIMTILI